MKKSKIDPKIEPKKLALRTRNVSLGAQAYKHTSLHIKQKSCFPSFTFSTISRFDNSINDKLKKISLLLNKSFECSNSPQKPQIINPTVISSKEKLRKIQSFANKEKINSSIIRTTQKYIHHVKSESKTEKLNEKFHKFKLRQNIHENSKVLKTWIVLLALSGTGFLFKKIIENRQRLRRRCFKNILWLRSVSRAIGKLSLKFKSIRFRINTKKIEKSYKRLNSILKHSKIWLKHRKKTFCDFIINTLELHIDQSTIISLMYAWNQQILKIQRFLKKAIRYRRNLYAKLLDLWQKYEIFLFQESTKKRNTKKKSQINHIEIPSGNFRITSVSSSIKLKFIRNNIRNLVKNHSESIKIYKLLNKISQSPFDIEEKPNSSLSKPKDLNLQSEFTQEVFLTMIKDCAREKKNQRKNLRNQ